MNESIKIIPFPGIQGANIVISFHRNEDNGNKIESIISFFLAGENGTSVEWEPKHGPITRITECNADHDDARPHWFYKFHTGYGNWTQCAVNERGLPNAALYGDYEYIFNVLKDYL